MGRGVRGGARGSREVRMRKWEGGGGKGSESNIVRRWRGKVWGRQGVCLVVGGGSTIRQQVEDSAK